MSKKQQTRKSPNTGMWFLFALGLAATAGVGAYLKSNPSASIPPSEMRTDDDRKSVKDALDGKPAATTDRRDGKVEVIKPKLDDKGEELTYDKSHEAIPEGQDKVVFAVNRFLEESKIVPAGAKLDSVEVKDKIATLKFNAAFDRTYGTEDERVLVDGILHTVGQFAEIEKVQFTIGGEPMETLGNIDLTTPQTVLR